MSGRQRLWGKFRGHVIDNVDVLGQGRLRVEVPSALGFAASWAMPCVPYAGPGVGFCFTPPVGANVWIEFEQGNPDLPIWVGCFWGEGERPAEAADPMVHLIKTETATFILDDAP